jgi:hypothetical protein
MTTERSDKLFEKWKESTEKFDYFVLGVLGAMFAYVSQGYKPEKLGTNPGTLELFALLVLALAAVMGFRRIEATNQGTLINQRLLHANERRGILVQVLQQGPGLNNQTGKTYTPEYALQQIPKIGEQIKQFELQIKASQDRALYTYKSRNYLTLLGFMLLLGAKLWTAYT